MKVTFICTVLNEEKTIDLFLDSLLKQTRMPEEVVIVDGGSTDGTILKIKKQKAKIQIKLLERKGFNRSQGRNEAIRNADGDIIVVSDAGCILDRNWLKEIVKPFDDKNVGVVAGYYRPLAYSVFEKCVVPFVLVMPDKVNQNKFLPASRSMAIKKEVFLALGGFPEKFSDNEDFVFANILKDSGTKIIFQKEAIVNWIPRSNLKDFWTMIYRFARGDAKAGLRKLKVAGIFLRYLFFITFCWIISKKLPLTAGVICLTPFLAYLIWSIGKNYRYVLDKKAFFWLPILQIVSDFAVMSGSIEGWITK